MIIGSHVSFSKQGLVGAVNEVLSYGGNAFMFYTGAPQNTIRKDIDTNNVMEAHEIFKKNNISIDSIIVHAPYIINLATSKEEQREFSVNFLKNEIERCKILGVKYVVLHPGNAVGITKEDGISNLIDSLKKIADEDVCVTIETMAGKGTELCSNIDELSFVFDSVKDLNFGVTLDTCHLNDSGVDISKFDEYLDEFDKKIGIDKIKCIHLNDSKNELGLKKDRHENIGFGTIGYDSLLNVAYNDKLKNVPKILETPYIKEGKSSFAPYKHEIEMLRKKEFNNNLIEDILN